MKDARFDLRIDSALKRRVEVEAEKRGQTLTKFVERALEAALTRAEQPSDPPQGMSRADAFRSATSKRK